jgi:seryl-tRNA synthetase
LKGLEKNSRRKERENASQRKEREEILDRLFDVNKEVALLVEIKDIRDELTIILKVLSDQHAALTAVASELSKLDAKLVPQGADAASLYKLRHEVVDANIRDFNTMMAHANGIYQGV